MRWWTRTTRSARGLTRTLESLLAAGASPGVQSPEALGGENPQEGPHKRGRVGPGFTLFVVWNRRSKGRGRPRAQRKRNQRWAALGTCRAPPISPQIDEPAQAADGVGRSLCGERATSALSESPSTNQTSRLRLGGEPCVPGRTVDRCDAVAVGELAVAAASPHSSLAIQEGPPSCPDLGITSRSSARFAITRAFIRGRAGEAYRSRCRLAAPVG